LSIVRSKIAHHGAQLGERSLKSTPASARIDPSRCAADPAPIEASLDYRIGHLRKLLDRYSSPVIAAEFGLKLAEWRVLSHIHSGSPVTAIWLGRRLQADRAEISRACASLARRGYIARGPNPDDGRSSLIEITEAGRALYDRIMPVRRRLQQELVGILTPGELSEFYRVVDKLTAAVSGKIDAGDERTKRPR
jgi:DNA-binding MarR family transcriptional regulator